MKIYYWLLLIAMLGLIGCNISEVDNDKAMESAIEKVRASLPESERPKFDMAVKTKSVNSIQYTRILIEYGIALDDAEKKEIN